MKTRSRELILFGMLGGITAAMQMALSFLPNVEVVTLLIILFSLIYKKKTLYIVCTFVILMGLLHGFGLWWLGYVILWPLLSLLTIFLRKKLMNNYLAMSIYSGAFGFLFGFFYAIPYGIFGGFNAGLSYWIAGIPFDIVHGVGNYFIMLFLGKRVFNVLVKLSRRYFHEIIN